MKVPMASLGEEPASEYLYRLRLAEELGFASYFHNDG